MRCVRWCFTKMCPTVLIRAWCWSSNVYVLFHLIQKCLHISKLPATKITVTLQWNIDVSKSSFRQSFAKLVMITCTMSIEGWIGHESSGTIGLTIWEAKIANMRMYSIMRHVTLQWWSWKIARVAFVHSCNTQIQCCPSVKTRRLLCKRKRSHHQLPKPATNIPPAVRLIIRMHC